MGGRGPEGGGGHLGENNCEDYLECSDVSNASSCSAFDANNNLLSKYAASAATIHQFDPQPASISAINLSDTSAQGVGGTAAAQLVYSAAAGSIARAEITMIESSAEKMGPFKHTAV